MEILLYHATDERKKQITNACRLMKIKVKEITQKDFAQKVGFLAGIKGYEANTDPVPEKVPQVEIMILHNFSKKNVDAFLKKMRALGIASTGIKATVTQINKDWTFSMLANELLEEHLILNMGQ